MYFKINKIIRKKDERSIMLNKNKIVFLKKNLKKIFVMDVVFITNMLGIKYFA